MLSLRRRGPQGAQSQRKEAVRGPAGEFSKTLEEPAVTLWVCASRADTEAVLTPLSRALAGASGHLLCQGLGAPAPAGSCFPICKMGLMVTNPHLL